MSTIEKIRARIDKISAVIMESADELVAGRTGLWGRYIYKPTPEETALRAAICRTRDALEEITRYLQAGELTPVREVTPVGTGRLKTHIPPNYCDIRLSDRADGVGWHVEFPMLAGGIAKV